MKMERDILPSGALYIGGDWREGRGAEITSVFPADGTVTRLDRGWRRGHRPRQGGAARLGRAETT